VDVSAHVFSYHKLCADIYIYIYIKLYCSLIKKMYDTVGPSDVSANMTFLSRDSGFDLFLLVISQAKRFGRVLYPHKIKEKNNFVFLARI